jgi:hypothetical protein
LSALLIGICCADAISANAAVNFYTDRALWAVAAGAATFTEDFSSFAADEPFHNTPVALNGMTISREGPEAGLSNHIDALPLTLPGGSGTNQAELFVNAIEGVSVGTNVRITFDQPAIAFGFDVWEAVGLEGARLDVYDGATQLRSELIPGGNAAFLGFVATAGEGADSVLFRANLLIVGTSGEGFAIDNLAGVGVPEPTAASLVALALGVGMLRSRKAAG